MCINDETNFCFPTSGRGILKPRSHRNATQRKKTQHGAACCGTSVRTLPAQRGLNYDCLYRSAPSRPQRTQVYAALMSGMSHDYRDCIYDWTTSRSSCFFVTLNLRPSVERSLHRTDRGTAPSSISA